MEQTYVARINRVLDYVQDNLSGDLSLRTLAKIACFSPYHFHRIFRALTGETVGQLVRRMRLERAARHLAWTHDRSIIEVALDAGFQSPAAFTRAFRDRFGMSPTEWRTSEQSKIGKDVSKARRAAPGLQMYLEDGAWAPKWRFHMPTAKMNVDVEVRELPERTIAYLRHTGPYQGNTELFGRLFQQLAQWAGARNLLGPSAQFMSLYSDDPAVTDPDKLRVTCGCVVPPGTAVDGPIGLTTVAGGKYGVGHFELSADQYGQAWDAMYSGWLPNSGFEPDDRPALELYLNDPNSHPEHKHIVEICVPVKPL